MKQAILILGAIALLGAVGCGSQDAPMSPSDRAQFAGGGPGSVRSPQQQHEMNDFIADFNKKHPRSVAAPQGAAQSGPPQ